jgi:hypothetical protein
MLQEEYQALMKQILEEWDQRIMEKRDTKRYRCKDLREVSVETAFGTVKYERRLYEDREMGKTVYLLDQVLQFDGKKGLSPHLEEMAIHWATDGPSYRSAAERLEEFLGYRPLSHEAIRNRVLQAAEKEESWCSKEKKSVQVLFVEVDGLHVRMQQRGRCNNERKSKEQRIAIVHEGWESKGGRTNLKHHRHFKQEGQGDFWEAFDDFLQKHYEIDENTWIVVGGDGAQWIGECTSYFQQCVYMLDRFHVARDLKKYIGHLPKEWKSIRKMLASGDGSGLVKQVQKIGQELIKPEHREDWKRFVQFLVEHEEHLKDYREVLKEQGIDTSKMRPMGSAEAQMRVFARRMKGNGRSWSKKGANAMIRMIIASRENWHQEDEQEEAKTTEPIQTDMRNLIKERTKESIGVIKAKIPILHGSSQASPTGKALKSLSGRECKIV